MVRIDIDVDDDAAQRMLSKMKMRAEDMIPVFKHAQSELEKANAENFATGGLPSGGWPPRTRKYAWKIMVKTGKLADSLTSLTGPPNVITPTFAEFGTSVEYAHFHQSGTTKMAQRKVVFEPRGFSKEIGDAAADYIIRGSLFAR
jgi:phage gpG-like protein